LLKIKNLDISNDGIAKEIKDHFGDATNLTKLKKQFVRYATEEIMRRQISKEATTVVNDKAAFEQCLFSES